MNHVLNIRLKEPVNVNRDRLGELYAQLGESGAEDVVCRAMEEIALRLSHCSRLHAVGNREEMRKCTRSMVAIADQIGMHALAKVAGDVTICLDACDDISTAATLARLLRIGEQSLMAIWNLQDLTI